MNQEQDINNNNNQSSPDITVNRERSRALPTFPQLAQNVHFPFARLDTEITSLIAHLSSS